MAYIGTEGYLVNCELRKGKQHYQKHTPEFLRETIRMCRELTDEPLLIRLDSGNDAAENIGILVESGCYFIIKRNLRKESKEDWLKMAQENSLDTESPREGKTVYIGSDWKSGMDVERLPSGKFETNELENWIGEYDYLSDYGIGRLLKKQCMDMIFPIMNQNPLIGF